MAARGFRTSRGGPSGIWLAGILVPGLILVAMFIFYSISRTVDRPPELSIARDPADPVKPRSAPSGPTHVPTGMILGIGGGILLIVGVIVAVNMKGKRPELTPMPRRAPLPIGAATPAPGPSPVPTNHADTMECPNCAERIKKKALVCRYCGFKFDLFVERGPKPTSSDDPDRTEPG